MPILFLLLFSLSAFGANVWEDDLRPTLKEAGEREHLLILGAGIASTWGASNFDGNVRSYRNNGGELLIGKREGRLIDRYTYGTAQILTAGSLLLADTNEGARLTKALVLTSLSHLTLSNILSRERPRHSDDQSLPSGHTATMFALAGTLSGSYGWRVGLVSYGAAVMSGLSRIKEDDHWFSDVVAGAFLGTYWARVVHGGVNPNYVVFPVMTPERASLTVAISW